jgi:hypothetical protein
LIFFVGLALLRWRTLCSAVRSRAGVSCPTGLLIAIGAVLYVVGGLSLALFGPESPLVTIIETRSAVPFGLGFVWLGYSLWRGGDRVRRTVPSVAR